MEFIFPIVIAALITGGFFLCANNRKPPLYDSQRPKRMQSFEASLPVEETFKVALRFVQQSAHKMTGVDEGNRYLTFAESGSLVAFGFWYSVYLSEQGTGNTLVEIGITPKLPQFGPYANRQMQRKLQDCLSGLQASVITQK